MAIEKKNKQDNLKPFKPGSDSRRNIKGRPKKLPEIDKILIEVLGKKTADGYTVAEQILHKIAQKALTGNLMAADMLLNRAYGKIRMFDSQDVDDAGAFLEAMKAASLRRKQICNIGQELSESTIVLTQQITVTSNESTQIGYSGDIDPPFWSY